MLDQRLFVLVRATGVPSPKKVGSQAGWASVEIKSVIGAALEETKSLSKAIIFRSFIILPQKLGRRSQF